MYTTETPLFLPCNIREALKRQGNYYVHVVLSWIAKPAGGLKKVLQFETNMIVLLKKICCILLISIKKQ